MASARPVSGEIMTGPPAGNTPAPGLSPLSDVVDAEYEVLDAGPPRRLVPPPTVEGMAIEYGIAPPPLTPPVKGEGNFAARPQSNNPGNSRRNGGVGVSLPLEGRGQGWGYSAAGRDENFMSDSPPVEGMAMLRPAGPPRAFRARGGPLFWAAGLAAAFAAFWVAGGHAVIRRAAFPAAWSGDGAAFSITGVTSRVDASGLKPVLFVDGEAGNDGASAAALPPLEIRVTGDDGAVTRYTLGTSGRALAPGQSLAFSSRLDVPRNGVHAVSVRFTE